MLADIDKQTVPMVKNYNGELDEPSSASPPANLLLNGSTGIAVGMAAISHRTISAKLWMQ